ncbi:hypothetical protein [Rubrobacter aplysinae]|uniref:hypothetical protein n=1 Tax=Rubrobacter aplysinae TaxID=909625 RepID=UPI00064BC657|nr:hypothetical protein [Rubrobacter aplysinae]
MTVAAAKPAVSAALESEPGNLGEAARRLVQEELGRPMNEMRAVMLSRREAGHVALAEGSCCSLSGSAHETVAGAVGSGESRDGDPEAMTRTFLGPISGLLDARAVAATGSGRGGVRMAPEMVGVFLKRALARKTSRVRGGGA